MFDSAGDAQRHGLALILAIPVATYAAGIASLVVPGIGKAVVPTSFKLSQETNRNVPSSRRNFIADLARLRLVSRVALLLWAI